MSRSIWTTIRPDNNYKIQFLHDFSTDRYIIRLITFVINKRGMFLAGKFKLQVRQTFPAICKMDL